MAASPCYLPLALLLANALAAQHAGEPSLSADVTFGTTVVIPSGLRGVVYFIPKNTTVLPDFQSEGVQRVGEIWTNELNILPRHWHSGFPGLTDRFEWFAIDYTGRFWVAHPGRYTFALLSDDGSRMFLDGSPVIDNDCQHSPDLRIAAVQLEGGVHSIRVLYFQGPRDCLALVLAVAGPDRQWSIFDLREFEPPSDPAEWSFPTDRPAVVVPTTPEEASLTVDLLTKQLRKDAPRDDLDIKSKADRGCRTPAIRICGN